MIVAESALGRMTQKSPVGAFRFFGKKKWISFGGWINAVIPILIVPYYSVIGGWVIKYLAEYIRGNGAKLAEDGYFGSFISNGVSTELCFVIFCLVTLAIIYAGVQNEADDAGSRITFRGDCHLFCDKTGSYCGCEIFSGSECTEFFMDDSRSCDGADVLFAVNCHGYPDHIWFLYEEGYVH